MVVGSHTREITNISSSRPKYAKNRKFVTRAALTNKHKLIPSASVIWRKHAKSNPGMH
jgi:hypothetical protein